MNQKITDADVYAAAETMQYAKTLERLGFVESPKTRAVFEQSLKDAGIYDECMELSRVLGEQEVIKKANTHIDQ